MGLGRQVFYPLSWLVAELLVTAAALAHPALVGDGATQLATIAASGGWTTIHWTFLFAFPLSITGLIGVVGVNVGTPGESAGRAGLVGGGFAYACWVIRVAFMLGSG